MSEQTINTLYDFVLQQMAAESYIESGYASVDVEAALNKGANREKKEGADQNLNEGYVGFTRMSRVQISEFLKKFKVVNQWSDNPDGQRPGAVDNDTALKKLNIDILANTGLSATLINRLNDQGQPTDQYTLSIRSTEFLNAKEGGDFERDGTEQDAKGIVLNGFALAQLNALEKYYAWLKETGKLPPNAKLSVTGFSLGGHLATVFTEIHKNDANLIQAVTFNGAGRGSWDTRAGNELDMIKYFDRLLNDPDFVTPDALAVLALSSTPPMGGVPPTAVTEPLYLAAKLKKGSAFSSVNVYDDPRYKWAETVTAIKFGLTLNINRAAADITGGKLTQINGYELINNVNVTVNSGVHEKDVSVGVESQPLLSGIPFLYGDFGQAHSITLIADSLAVQRVLAQLDSTYSLERFLSLMPFATHRKPVTSIVPLLSKANYETDALENILDGIRRMVLGKSIKKTEFKDGAGGFGDLPTREKFYNNIQELSDDATFKSLKDKVTASPMNRSGMDKIARTSFTALVSLLTLSPVQLTARAGKEAEVENLLANHWSTEHEHWLEDKTLVEQGKAPKYYTQKWLEDRNFVLNALMGRNAGNFGSDVPEGEYVKMLFPADAWGDNYAFGLEDRKLKVKIQYGYDSLFSEILAASTHNEPAVKMSKYIFGDESDDTIAGDSLEDHLYGNDGNDALSGLKGNDYIEGNDGNDDLAGGEGNDTLVGGKGHDRYYIRDGEGLDRIIDSDGDGEISLGGINLATLDYGYVNGGTKNSWSQKLPEQTAAYQYALDAATNVLSITYLRTTVLVENFHDGDFGIHAPLASSEASYNVGDEVKKAAFMLNDIYFWELFFKERYASDLEYGYVSERIKLAADSLSESNNNPSVSYHVVDNFNIGVAGPRVFERTVPEYLMSYGYPLYPLAFYYPVMFSGNDVFEGGLSLDKDYGGAVLKAYGNAGDDQLYATYQASLGDALLQTERSVNGSVGTIDLSGGQGNDTIFGSGGDDFLLGGGR